MEKSFAFEKRKREMERNEILKRRRKRTKKSDGGGRGVGEKNEGGRGGVRHEIEGRVREGGEW